MTILDRAIVRALPAVPRPVVKRLSSRYIAGTTLAEACETVRALNAERKEATLDVLGEEVTLREEAAGLRDAYRRALDTIEEEGLRSNISVKLTALGPGYRYPPKWSPDSRKIAFIDQAMRIRICDVESGVWSQPYVCL